MNDAAAIPSDMFTPHAVLMDVTVYVGDVLAVLRSLPEQSVHCCVTSPPYWGLRDYGLPPSVWGDDPGCAHVWGDRHERHEVREAIIAGKARTTDRFYGEPSRRFIGQHEKHTAGEWCRHCDAWRGAYGLEPTPELYVEHTVEVFRAVRRVLRSDGTVWLNLGDAYCSGTRTDRAPTTIEGRAVPASWQSRCQPNRIPKVPGLKAKDLIGLPWRVALALQADGWYLRSDIIWAKPNPMPESVADRPTRAHEYVFLLSQRERYFYDATAVREPHAAKSFTVSTTPRKGSGSESKGERFNQWLAAGRGRVLHPDGRNRRSVWTIATEPFPGAHFATFPRKLVEPCIRAGTSERGCCPACGAPYIRHSQVSYRNPGNRTTNGPRSVDRRHETAGFPIRLERSESTIGWQVSCHCDAGEPVPCVVLDPFGGSGTVSVVARQLGRRSIYVDLNPGYAEMAIKRLQAQAPLRRAA